MKKSDEIISARQRLTSDSVESSLDSILQRSLDEICDLTGSEIGFYHFVEPDQQTISLQMWSTRTLQEFCTYQGKGSHYPVSKAGIWVDCIHEGRAVIHNDYQSLPHKKGYPEGHAEVRRELVVPIFREGKIVAILGVGNKPEDYDEDDVRVVSCFADLVWDIAEKKKVLLEIEGREKRFKQFFNSNPSATFVWEVVEDDFILKEANDSAQLLTDNNARKFVGLPAGTIYRDLPFMVEKLRKCAQNRNTLDFQQHYKTRYAGRYEWVNFRLTFVEPNVILLYADTITEQKEMEMALLKSEERFSLAMEFVQDGVYDWQLSTDEMYFSPGYKKMLGYGDEDIQNEFSELRRLTHPEDLDSALKKLMDLAEGRISQYRDNIRMKHKEGHWVHILSRANVVRNEENEPIRIVGTHVDITPQKRWQHELELKNAAIEKSLNGFDIISEDGKFLYVNKAYVRMWGYESAEEILGTSPVDHCQDPKTPEIIINTLKEKGSWELEFTARRKDGSTFDVLMSATLEYDHEGNEIYTATSWDTSRRNEAERAAKENSDITRALLNASRESIFLIDSGGYILAANEITAERLGCTLEELIGRCAYELLPQDVARSRKAHIDKAFSDGKPVRYQDARDDIFFDHYLYPVLRGEKGLEESYMAVYSRDVTREEKTRKALQESEKKFRNMFHSAPISYQALDEAGNFKEVNQTWKQQFGYQEEEVLGRNFSEFISQESGPHFREDFQCLISEGEVRGVEFKMVSKNGEQVLVSCHANVSRKQDGEFERTHWVLTDITRQKEAEVKLQQELDLNKVLAQISKELLSESYKLNRVSQVAFEAALSLTGSREGVLLSVNSDLAECKTNAVTEGFSLVYAFRDKQEAPAASCEERVFTGPIGQAIMSLKPVYFNRPTILPQEVSTSDKIITCNNIIAVPITLGEKLFGVIAVANKQADYSDDDVTTLARIGEVYALALHRDEYEVQRAEMESTLRRMQKHEAIGALAGGIAHDFNNILVPVIGYAEMLEDDMPLDSSMAECVSEILAGAERAKELVKQILTFSRQHEEEIKPIKPHIVISEVLKLIKATIPTTIEFHSSINKECRSILADPTQLHQVAMNLITNAYQAIESGHGTISVTLQNQAVGPADSAVLLSEGNYVVMTIADNGTGMDRSTMEKVFDPYFTTKPKDKGTGLGLSVVYGIVKTYKGEITVTSEPGVGSTFVVYFPAVESSYLKEGQSSTTSEFRGDEKILIVDDEDSILKLMEKMLSRLGYQISRINSSVEALDELEAFPDRYDLVITDMAMPKIGGDVLIQRVRKITADLPIILCTGFSERMSAERAARLGANAFLLKPISKVDLSKAVREVLDAARR